MDEWKEGRQEGRKEGEEGRKERRKEEEEGRKEGRKEETFYLPNYLILQMETTSSEKCKTCPDPTVRNCDSHSDCK